VEAVDPKETDRYGIVSLAGDGNRVAKLEGIVEKPHPDEAPSNLGVVGRYVFTPRLLDHLVRTGTGAGGEIQLTDAIGALLREEPVYAYQFEGQRFDCGSKRGMLRATLAFGLKDPELREDVVATLDGLRAGDARN